MLIMSNCSRREKTMACAIQQWPQSFIRSGRSAKEIRNRFHLVEYEQYVSYITQYVGVFLCNTPLILEELKTVLYIAVVGYQSNSTSLVQLLWCYTAIKRTGNLLMNIQCSIKNIFSYPYNQAALSPSPDTCTLIHFMLFSSSASGELIGKIALRHEPKHQLNQTRGLNHGASPAHSQWWSSFIPSVIPPVSWK